jgi:hypothetical protein
MNSPAKIFCGSACPGNTYDYVPRGYKRYLTPHNDGWYYLTMSYRVTWHPLDDPTLYRIGYIREVCSRLLRETRRKVGFSQRALSAASRGEPLHGGEGGAGPAESVDGYIGTIDGCDGNGARDSNTVSDGIRHRCGRGSAARCQHRCRPQNEDDLDSNHEEDDAPDPADKTEEELNEDIDRILEEVPL